MPLPAAIEQPVREGHRVSLEPVQNAIASMMLLVKEEEMPGTGAWVTQMREKLTADELFRHRLVIIGFFHAILPEKDWTSFSDYLDDLENSNPVSLRDKMLDTYAEICIACDEETKATKVNWAEILKTPEAYVAFLTERFGVNLVEVEMETKAFEYVIDPPAMQKLIVDHLRWFWNEHLSQEWIRIEPLLQESVKAFQNANLDNMNRMELARYITGQDLDDDKWGHTLGNADQVVFIPNPHIGPYVTRMYCGKSVAVIFGARQPDDASVRIPELDRADIVARMSALADDTRLRILQMIAENDEMRSQDIIEAVGLSQPSVSRYLTQLTVTGYLQERRVNGAKAYALNRDRIEKTLKAVRKFLLGT
ncbi:MAG: helix-turn-helix transcriptional regulator [Anaerolineales bacterium]|nr:helix-turn-helix transcriptional regulator [Anaerolineales bacterium]